jgi:hypothetical protein
MTYILLNMIHDIATTQNMKDDPDPIIINITDILKNIECRSNLRQVIRNRMDVLLLVAKSNRQLNLDADEI